MKKTQWIELFYNIRHTFVSFTAIILFVALSAGLFTGIRWTVYSIAESIEEEYSRGHLHHFELSYPYGFDDAFMDKLVEDGIVSEVEGYYETYRFLRHNGSRQQVKVVSLTKSIDMPCCVEGTLPARQGEAAVNSAWAEENGIRIGDVISFGNDSTPTGFFLNAVMSKDFDALMSSADKSSELTSESFTVTALVSAAEYMGKYPDTNGMSPISSAPVNTVIYIAEQSFVEGAFCRYPKLVVRTDALDGLMTMSDNYQICSEQLEDAIKKAANDYTLQKNTAMRRSADSMRSKLDNLPERNAGVEQIVANLSKIEEYDAYIASRRMNGSFVGVRSVMQSFEKMQYSLVSLFVIIGILVCYSATSRLVYDQTVLTGTKKAVGFFPKEILKTFLIYSGIAAVIGSASGCLIGRFLVEPIMIRSVQETYRFKNAMYYFGMKEALIFSLIQCFLILLTAFVTSNSVSRKTALKLLNGGDRAFGRVPKFLEKLPLWNRMSLMKKNILCNCFKDHSRVFATLVGIMGCTALVVCAFSMYNNLTGSFTRNMDKVSQYDSIVHFSGETNTKEKLHTIFEENHVQYADSYYSLGTMQTKDGERVITGLYATDNDAFFDLFHLYDMNDGKEKTPQNGAWINIAYEKNFGASVGDTLTFTDAVGQSHKLVIEGFYEYYLMNYMVILPKSMYEKEFTAPYVSNTCFFASADSESEAIMPSLLELEDNLIIEDFYGGNEGLFESIAVIARAVVGVYLGLSFVLAVLLLLNLFTMFVAEKKKELIILMINGFRRKQAEQYIYFDTFFLTFLGSAVGILLGVIMGGFSLNSFRTIAAYFLNRVDLTACVFGVLYTAILTYIMCRIALRKVKKFRLADINTM